MTKTEREQFFREQSEKQAKKLREIGAYEYHHPVTQQRTRRKKKKNPGKFDRCVRKVRASGSAVNEYAVCATALKPKRRRRKKNPVRDPEHQKLLRKLGTHFSSDEAKLKRRTLYILVAKKSGKTFKYLGGIKFASRGRAALFGSKEHAREVGRSLLKRFPVLRSWDLYALPGRTTEH